MLKIDLAVLDGHHPAGGERAAVPQAVDLVEHGHLRVAGPQEVAVQRVDRPRRVDGPGRRHQGLPGHLAAEDPLAVLVGELPSEDVDLDGLEVEEPTSSSTACCDTAERLRSPAVSLEPDMLAKAEAARGFMPSDEGLALYEAALGVAVEGPLLEVGSYCGKSGVYLGAAAGRGRVLFAVDHHRGSEENQPGWEWHEPDLVDPAVGLMDRRPGSGAPSTTPAWRARWSRWSASRRSVARHWGDAAGVPVHRRRPRRRAGPHSTTSCGTPTSPPGGTSPSTTCSPTRPTAAARRTSRSTSPAVAGGRFVEERAIGSLRALRRKAD